MEQECKTFDVLLKQMQAHLKTVVSEGVSLVDELIKERREEAAREEEQFEEWRRMFANKK